MLLTNIRQFTDMEVVLLFTEHDFTVPLHFEKKWGCSVFRFQDRRNSVDALYIPGVRPWLLWQYLKAHPEAEREQYFYIDSDVIFREWPDFAAIKGFGGLDGAVVGSDCGSYLNLDYVLSCERGLEIAQAMADICGTTVEHMRGVPGIGAHLILTNPTAAFWQRAYEDSVALYQYFVPLKSNIQKWTAEMWAQLWGWVGEDMEIVASPELDFCRPTDPVAEWDRVKILHNAGVVGDGDMFFKGKYTDHSPFDDDLSHVRRDKATIKYVEAIQKVIH